MKKICLLALFLLLGVAVIAQSGVSVFDSAIGNFQNRRYAQALSGFRQILLDTQYAALRGDAYFWIAKVLIAQNRISDAERNLEFFLANFKKNSNFPEGMYQRGRVIFLSAQYEAAIQAFSEFITSYSSNPFVANAYYWTGEALFNLGQLENAEKMFNAVIEEFPNGSRVEASRYRLAVINMNRREQELLKLLQWTHEESIRSIEEFRRKELEYREAITSYQSRMVGTADVRVQEEINNLIGKIARLEDERATLQDQIDSQTNTIIRLENQIRSTRNNSASEGASRSATRELTINPDSEDFALRLELIKIKEETLALKESLITRLERLVQDSQEN